MSLPTMSHARPRPARARGIVRRFLRAWALALRIQRVTLKAQLEYRVEFVMHFLAGVVWQTSIVVFATVVLTRFPTMGSWDSGDVLLIASLRMLCHGLYVLFCGRMPFDFEWLVQAGALGPCLLRPMPVYRQIQLSSFPTNSLGDLSVAVFLIVLAMQRSSVDWTAGRLLYFLAAIVGGTLVESAMSTALGAAVMHFSSTGYWSGWVHEITETFGAYPLSIVPRGAGIFLTWILPVAFIAYLPVGTVTDHGGGLGVPGWIATWSPAVGVLLFVASRLLWNASLRRCAAVNL